MLPSLRYSAFRNAFCSIACAGVLPLINEVGVVTTNGLTAILTWLAFGYVHSSLVLITWTHGCFPVI